MEFDETTYDCTDTSTDTSNEYDQLIELIDHEDDDHVLIINDLVNNYQSVYRTL